MSWSIDGRVVGKTLYMNPNKTPVSKNPLASMWIGRCTISEYQDVTDPITHQTTQQEVVVVENEPCRLSHKSESTVNEENGAPMVAQVITLFIRPDITIPAGSVIEVTQNGSTKKFKQSSEPSIYSNHQEVTLSIDDDKA